MTAEHSPVPNRRIPSFPCPPSRSACSLALLLLLGLTFPCAGSAGTPASTPTTPADEPAYRGRTLSHLEAMLQDPNPRQRLSAIQVLRDAGAAAIPVLVWAFNDEDPNVRTTAVRLLGPLGAAGEDAVPAFADLLLADPVPAVRTQVIFTLSQIGPYATTAVRALRRVQREADITTRINASQALDRILGGQRP